jgi:phosphotransacetylase
MHHRWRPPLKQSFRVSQVRNEAKTFSLIQTKGAQVGSAEADRATEDRVKYWLQVMRRTGNGAQYVRDRRSMPNNFAQLCTRADAAVFGSRASTGLLLRAELIHYCIPKASSSSSKLLGISFSTKLAFL